jgi:cell division protein FtsB
MLRSLAMVLVVLVLVLGWQLFNGAGGIRDVHELAVSVRVQQRENAQLIARNDALAAEVTDLKQGEAALEERARTELGMIKPGEVFYRVVDAGDLPPAEPDKERQ